MSLNGPRHLFSLIILATLILSAYLVFDYRHYQYEREAKSIALGQRAGIKVADTLDALLSELASNAEKYASRVAAIENQTELLESIRAESLRHPLILGVTVAFEPGAFKGKERYSPFFNKKKSEFQFVENSYDYTDNKLATAQWYTSIIESGENQWSDPYYAKAADAMVVDYGVPLRDSQGEIIGVVDYTLTLRDFTEIVDSLSVGEAGYGFTYTANGDILSHPNPEFLLENIYQLKDGKDASILEKLKNDPEGVVAYNSTYTYNYSWFFFREIPATGWKSVIVFAEDDLLGASDTGRRKIIHIAFSASLFLSCLLIASLSRQPRQTKKLWYLAMSISLIIIANILLIWRLNLITDFSKLETEQERIVNSSILNKYVTRYDNELYKLTQKHYHTVPTGLFIESYELSSFEASLIGKLWMKYPKYLYDVAPPDFYFPDISAMEARGINTAIISEVEYDDYTLVTWRFRAMLEQDFSYQQYPFDQNNVQLVIEYPDPSKNILLVPDLESYDILNPSVKPGLNQNLTTPSSETVSSFFSFKELTYRNTFGNPALSQSPPALSFVIGIKRIYLSPFIANIIPILIVALIMFIVLYISSNKEDEKAGLTIMNVVQSSAGFLFILVLAHVNERARIETPEIAYIELFYFSMYVFLTLELIVLAMLLRGSQWKLFKYQDNLILKLLFWPVLLAIWLGVTLLRFY